MAADGEEDGDKGGGIQNKLCLGTSGVRRDGVLTSVCVSHGSGFGDGRPEILQHLPGGPTTQEMGSLIFGSKTGLSALGNKSKSPGLLILAYERTPAGPVLHRRGPG